MSISDFLAKITGQADRLEAAISTLEADHKAAIAAKDQEIADLNALLNKAPSAEALVAKDTEIAELTRRVEAAEAAAAPEKINSEVARIVAAQGHSPVETVVAGKTEGKTMSLAAFKALNHAERKEFLKAGGKLSD